MNSNSNSSRKEILLIVSQVYPPDPAAVGQYLEEVATSAAGGMADPPPASAEAPLDRSPWLRRTGGDSLEPEHRAKRGQLEHPAQQGTLEQPGGGRPVQVLTANRGYDDPSLKLPAKELRGGVVVRRLPWSSFGKASIPVRIFAQLSFLVQCIVRGLFRRGLTDLLVSTSPPMAAVVAVVVGFFRPRVRVHYWVMDINPDQSVALGAFGPRHPLVLALDWLNRRILKRADTIVTLDRFMAQRLLGKLGAEGEERGAGSGEVKLEHPAERGQIEPRRSPATRGFAAVIPPWPLDGHLEPVGHAANPFRREQGWADKFVVMFSGNHSLVHPLTTLLDAADRLSDDPRFVFAFIGGGKGKAEVEERIATRSPSPTSEFPSPISHLPSPNIVSLPYQALDQIKYSLSAADLHVVVLGDAMSGIVHPCKIYGAMAVGRPILYLGPEPSYVTDILDRDAIGWSVRHGDVDGTVAALRAAAALTPGEREAMGRRACEAVQRDFARERLLGEFWRCLG